MKRIEDAPKELQDMFAKLWREKKEDCMYPKDYAEQFFLAGFDTAMATGGLPKRPKRLIAHITEMGSHVYVLSTDGKLFRNHWATPQEWQALPDLPED